MSESNLVPAKPAKSLLRDMAAVAGIEAGNFYAAIKAAAGCKGATDEHFMVLLMQAERYGLDPLSSPPQIQLIDVGQGPQVYARYDAYRLFMHRAEAAGVVEWRRYEDGWYPDPSVAPGKDRPFARAGKVTMKLRGGGEPVEKYVWLREWGGRGQWLNRTAHMLESRAWKEACRDNLGFYLADTDDAENVRLSAAPSPRTSRAELALLPDPLVEGTFADTSASVQPSGLRVDLPAPLRTSSLPGGGNGKPPAATADDERPLPSGTPAVDRTMDLFQPPAPPALVTAEADKLISGYEAAVTKADLTALNAAAKTLPAGEKDRIRPVAIAAQDRIKAAAKPPPGEPKVVIGGMEYDVVGVTTTASVVIPPPPPTKPKPSKRATLDPNGPEFAELAAIRDGHKMRRSRVLEIFRANGITAEMTALPPDQFALAKGLLQQEAARMDAEDAADAAAVQPTEGGL